MIEVNLHPTGGKAGRSRRPTLATPAWLGSGRNRGDGRDPWTLAAMVAAALAVLLIGGLWFTQRSSRSEIDARLEVLEGFIVALLDPVGGPARTE